MITEFTTYKSASLFLKLTIMLKLSAKTVGEIYEHAKREYPEECCGIILSKNDSDVLRPCANIQNKLHTQEPDKYPRTARSAYAMDAQEIFNIFKEAEENKMQIKAFYHSHPNHDAYFSAEDKTQATAWDEPLYPDSTYIVISIYDGKIKGLRAYAWNESKRDFVQIPVSKVPKVS